MTTPTEEPVRSDPPFSGEPLDPNSADDWALFYRYTEPSER